MYNVRGRAYSHITLLGLANLVTDLRIWRAMLYILSTRSGAPAFPKIYPLPGACKRTRTGFGFQSPPIRRYNSWALTGNTKSQFSTSWKLLCTRVSSRSSTRHFLPCDFWGPTTICSLENSVLRICLQSYRKSSYVGCTTGLVAPWGTWVTKAAAGLSTWVLFRSVFVVSPHVWLGGCWVFIINGASAFIFMLPKSKCH